MAKSTRYNTWYQSKYRGVDISALTTFAYYGFWWIKITIFGSKSHKSSKITYLRAFIAFWPKWKSCKSRSKNPNKQGLWLDLFYHELQSLVSPWSLKVLCVFVLRSQKGLARYHLVISYHDCFEKLLSSEIYYYCSLVDYAIDMCKHET